MMVISFVLSFLWLTAKHHFIEVCGCRDSKVFTADRQMIDNQLQSKLIIIWPSGRRRWRGWVITSDNIFVVWKPWAESHIITSGLQ